jgi:hypothetical protein
MWGRTVAGSKLRQSVSLRIERLVEIAKEDPSRVPNGSGSSD